MSISSAIRQMFFNVHSVFTCYIAINFLTVIQSFRGGKLFSVVLSSHEKSSKTPLVPLSWARLIQML